MTIPNQPETRPHPESVAGDHEPPFTLRPEATSVFADRARRFASLATGHAQGDWLRFLGQLSERQHAALALVADAPLPTASALQQGRTHAMPPLTVAGWSRNPAWRQVLAQLLDGLDAHLPAAAQPVLQRLQQAAPDELETLAGGVLNYSLESDADRAAGVFVGAALQVYWTALAARLDASLFARLDSKGLCPCCGSLPVASIVRVAASTTGDAATGSSVSQGINFSGSQGGNAVANLRYLHCALCNTEWNLVRVTCAHCEDNAKVAYRSLEGPNVPSPAVRAETCDACHSYLKIIYQEKDPLADPVADDLATLALDLLLDEAGYQRCGPNLLLLPGTPE